LDLGVAYRPKNSLMTVGFVAKNINSPTFSVDSTPSDNPQGDFKIDPSFKAGISIPVWNDNFEFAFDADLNKNDTLIDGEQSQFIGGGVEYHPSSWFALRAGAMQDLASEKFDDGVIMTAGVGFGLKWLQVDLSVMMSSKKGEFDGQTIPRYASANLSIVSRWGDGYNKLPPKSNDNIKTENISSNPYKIKRLKTGMSYKRKRHISQQANKAYKELDKEVAKR